LAELVVVAAAAVRLLLQLGVGEEEEEGHLLRLGAEDVVVVVHCCRALEAGVEVAAVDYSMQEAVVHGVSCQLLGEEARPERWMVVVVAVLQQVPLAAVVEEGLWPLVHRLQISEEEAVERDPG
jgi:hypothetical protein